jgi:hypothetical protein
MLHPGLHHVQAPLQHKGRPGADISFMIIVTERCVKSPMGLERPLHREYMAEISGAPSTVPGGSISSRIVRVWCSELGRKNMAQRIV